MYIVLGCFIVSVIISYITCRLIFNSIKKATSLSETVVLVAVRELIIILCALSVFLLRHRLGAICPYALFAVLIGMIIPNVVMIFVYSRKVFSKSNSF
ncbi:MAG: hypothetical protein RR394_07115 [Oscillospiraceae bacterium]